MDDSIVLKGQVSGAKASIYELKNVIMIFHNKNRYFGKVAKFGGGGEYRAGGYWEEKHMFCSANHTHTYLKFLNISHNLTGSIGVRGERDPEFFTAAGCIVVC